MAATLKLRNDCTYKALRLVQDNLQEIRAILGGRASANIPATLEEGRIVRFSAMGSDSIGVPVGQILVFELASDNINAIISFENTAELERYFTIEEGTI